MIQLIQQPKRLKQLRNEMADIPNKDWLSMQEVADFFGISKATVWRGCADGTIPFAHVGPHTKLISRVWVQSQVNAANNTKGTN